MLSSTPVCLANQPRAHSKESSIFNSGNELKSGHEQVADFRAVATELRAEMPVANKYAYFDHAAVAPLPKSAAKAIAKYAQDASENGDAVWLSWAAGISQLRDSAAAFLSASASEIALIPNTSFGINLVAAGFPWRAGDNLLVPANEFPSNLLPWRDLERLGVEVREIEVPDSGEVLLERLESQIDARTRLIAVSWVGFISGYRIDVAELVDMAHRRGCLVMLDAIQGLGAFPIDVKETGVDFLAADGHKWLLGPEGAGIFYCREEHLKLLHPVSIGWNSLAAGAFDPRSSQLKSTAARYEGGTMPMPGMLGFRESLDLLSRLGADGSASPVAAAVLDNVETLCQRLQSENFECQCPVEPQRRSGIMGITWPEARFNSAASINSAASANSDTAYVAARKFLLEQDIVTSVRGNRLRIGTHAYNDASDIGRLVDALCEVRERVNSSK